MSFSTRVCEVDHQSMLAAFGMDPSLLASNIEAISNLFGREVHLMNVQDDEYSQLLQNARLAGTRWKGRTRDFKGQFCKMKFERDVLWAWSHRIHDWTVVLPWTFGQLLTPLVAQMNDDAVRNNLNAQWRLNVYERDSVRNYSTTTGRRSQHRMLSSKVHRQHLTGRRNHFVSVPKQA